MADWLITLQIQISIAVVAILILRQAIKKMPKIYSYLLWLLVFARLLIPVSVESRFSFMPSEQERDALVEQVLENLSEDSAVTETPEMHENPGNIFTDGQIGSSKYDADLAVGNLSETTVGETGAGEMSAEGMQSSDMDVPGPEGIKPEGVRPGGEGILSEGLTSGSENVAESMVSGEEVPLGAVGKSGMMWILTAIWAVGVTIVLGYNGMALYKVRQNLRNARYLVDSIQIGKGNAPVYVSDKINTPFSLGFLKPVIYLPAGLTGEEQEYILCHERVHISRKDNLVKHMAFLLTAIYWFNPFVWVAFFLMERDMEMSCDEKVLKLMGGTIKKNYSQSLLNFAAGRGKMPATHLTFGENSVKQRVKNVLSYKNAKAWTVGIGMLVLVIVVVALFTTGQEDVETNEPGQELEEGSDVPNQGDENSGEDQSPEDGTGAQFPEDGTGGAMSEVMDSTYIYPAIEEALQNHIGRFMSENIDVYYYDYDYDKLTDTATIRYSVREGSVWEEHVLLETVQVIQKNDLYFVEQESLTDYSTVETGADFEILYGTSGNQDLEFPHDWNGFYRHAIQQLQAGGAEAEYYARLTDPVLAAIDALNLGAGSGVAKLGDGTIISGGGTGSVLSDGSSTFTGTINGNSAVGTTSVDIYLKEGTCAYVTYTFDKDDSTVEFPVYLVEESYGLWSVNKNDVRKIVQELNQWQKESFPERLGFTIEFTDMGIYRNTDGVLTNIFPHYIPSNLEWWESNGILYFPIDSHYQEGYLDYAVDTICMLDLTTGEYDKETLSLESLPINDRNVVELSVHSGYIHLSCGYSASSSKYYVMPLINTGNTPLTTGYTYNGKAVKDLTKAEQDAYGVVMRDEILKKGEVMEISNRTMTETYTYVDLDGDGKTEKIVLSANKIDAEYKYVTYPYDCFKLQVGDSFVTGQKEGLENGILLFSPDGENIVIALYGTGPSDDYTIMMYLYKDGELRSLRDVECDINDIRPDTAKGVFYVHDSYSDFVQPVWFMRTYRINESGQLEEVPQETYDIIYGRTILPDLLVPLPVYETPGGDGEVTYIQPQKVDFIKMDNTYRWVYVEAADGTGGWFGFDVERTEDGYIDVRVKGLDLHHWEVFVPYYAG